MDQVQLGLATVAGEENRLGRDDLSHLWLSGMHVMCGGGGCRCCGCCGGGCANGGHVNGRDAVMFEGLQDGVVGALRLVME